VPVAVAADAVDRFPWHGGVGSSFAERPKLGRDDWTLYFYCSCYCHQQGYYNYNYYFWRQTRHFFCSDCRRYWR
jgi:hypothetical protein